MRSVAALKGLGPALRRIRQARGIDRAAVAKVLDIDASGVSRYESESSRPHTRTLELYLDAIGATVSDLAAAMEGRPIRQRNAPGGDDEMASTLATLAEVANRASQLIEARSGQSPEAAPASSSAPPSRKAKAARHAKATGKLKTRARRPDPRPAEGGGSS